MEFLFGTGGVFGEKKSEGRKVKQEGQTENSKERTT